MSKTAALTANMPVLRSPAIKSAGLPAPRKWKQFDEFVDQADHMVDLHLAEIYPEPPDPHEPVGPFHPSRPEYMQHVTVVRDDCRQQLAEFDPPSAYDSDGDLDRKIIAKRVGIMLAAFSFPPSEAYVKLLIEHVSAAPRLSLPALEGACREIERGATGERAPSIGVILDIVRKEVARWWDRKSAIENYEFGGRKASSRKRERIRQ